MKELVIAALVAVPFLLLLRSWDRRAYHAGLGTAAGCAIGYAAAQGWLPPVASVVAVVVVVASLGWFIRGGGSR